MKMEPTQLTRIKRNPNTVNVDNTPILKMTASAIGVKTSPPKPRDETMIPVTSPLLSGNHFWQQAIVVV